MIDRGVESNSLWLGIGLLSQTFFFARFLIQWIMSEIRKKSYIPEIFWYLSVAGGLGLLIYSIHIKDPVFIIGQSVGLFVYLRNLYLIHSSGKTKSG
jgi:lipid-A-disaccharide synthase-like uncharacterized protein